MIRKYRIVVQGNDVFEAVRVVEARFFLDAYCMSQDFLLSLDGLTIEQIRVVSIAELGYGS